MTDYVPFQIKKLTDIELSIDDNQSLFYIFGTKPIHRNHTNTCDCIMNGTYALHVMDYHIMLQ